MCPFGLGDIDSGSRLKTESDFTERFGVAMQAEIATTPQACITCDGFLLGVYLPSLLLPELRVSVSFPLVPKLQLITLGVRRMGKRQWTACNHICPQGGMRQQPRARGDRILNTILLLIGGEPVRSMSASLVKLWATLETHLV